ncbi:MAG: pirin family protein [Bdellovibrionaceae bacterium]|nr:pirin family protein [Pseudobdellovibrionaceae bacterium]
MKILTRRILLSLLGITGLAAMVHRWQKKSAEEDAMIQKHFTLDFQWQTQEPFLFCVHHYDYYPKGNPNFGPDKALLVGRNMGQDFEGKDGFRMYHGDEVPGFPVHPHRGFETITIVRKGYVDHADSLGAAGRYGQGDVQWMTAGKGVQHSEMFPLLKQDQDNTMELFQIWLNLPKKSKMSEPHFTMFWNEKIPVVELDNKKVKLSIIAGSYKGTKGLPPPPDSWASQPESDTAVWLLKIEPGGEFEFPATFATTSRTLYLFEGKGATFNGQEIAPKSGLVVDASQAITVEAKGAAIEILMLQAKSIGEPVVQYGPFVMNSQAEIRQTMMDYQQTQFGGWPWKAMDQTHGPKIERFAKYPDGRIEKPEGSV